MNHFRTTLNLVAGITGGALVAHVLPTALFLPPVRRRCWPALAGIGRPDHVALTFDDGPHPLSTPHFLRRLQRYDTRATFFLLATALRRAPSLGRDGRGRT